MFERTTQSPGLAWQPSLLGDPAPGSGVGVDAAEPRRLQLDATSWVDHAPRWLVGADELFAELLEQADWQARDVVMWGTLVAEPRLTARWPAGDLPAALERVRAALVTRYGVGFDSVGVNLYRDGRDSVAWHRDRVGGRLRDPLVATITLGARRRFLLRPHRSTGRGGGSVSLTPGPGDLVVMGGACQHDWEHTVPKCADSGPRMAITVRHLRQPPVSPPPATGRRPA